MGGSLYVAHGWPGLTVVMLSDMEWLHERPLKADADFWDKILAINGRKQLLFMQRLLFQYEEKVAIQLSRGRSLSKQTAVAPARLNLYVHSCRDICIVLSHLSQLVHAIDNL